ncbi:MAG: phosphoribosylformylglycinamidine synthase subunit PurQ, partial [Rickettsiales bacterium]|nr:phosphoribosylformylglycinamidine synthase subunit PurQ [Rickettsiales bacterium]
QLEDEQRIAFRYADQNGAINDNTNPNGAMHNIAGILNANKNVLGMMPHPERACDALTAGTDGQALFRTLLEGIR